MIIEGMALGALTSALAAAIPPKRTRKRFAAMMSMGDYLSVLDGGFGPALASWLEGRMEHWVTEANRPENHSSKRNGKGIRSADGHFFATAPFIDPSTGTSVGTYARFMFDPERHLRHNESTHILLRTGLPAGLSAYIPADSGFSRWDKLWGGKDRDLRGFHLQSGLRNLLDQMAEERARRRLVTRFVARMEKMSEAQFSDWDQWLIKHRHQQLGAVAFRYHPWKLKYSVVMGLLEDMDELGLP